MSNGNQRIAVVIGGASGIGWATAQALAAQGDQVTIADRNADGARSRAAELGDPHTAESVDITDEDSVQHLFEQTGPVDVVVNCAGFSNVGLITDMPVDQFRDVVVDHLLHRCLITRGGTAAPRLGLAERRIELGRGRRETGLRNRRALGDRSLIAREPGGGLLGGGLQLRGRALLGLGGVALRADHPGQH